MFLMIFSLNFVLSVNNIRDYLEGEAEIHAQDTATSLGLSLSPYMDDEKDPVIETTMNAIFDMGYYQEIKLQNVESQTLVRLTNKAKLVEVPLWFIELIPMKVATANSEISSGWNIAGVVTVTINPGYAYLKLYQLAKNSFYFSAAAFGTSILLLFMVLRMTLSSIKGIDQAALTIAEGKFEKIVPLPWTTEVKNVAISINMMSGKIEGVINNLNGKLNTITNKLQQDSLTGLNNKTCFETDIKHLFDEHAEAYIFLIKIDGLAELVKELSHDAIDQFLQQFAQLLKNISEKNARCEIAAYRFVGSEFALLVRKSNPQHAEDIAQQLKKSLTELATKYGKSDIAHMGIIPFNSVETIDNMLLAANEAYEQAQLIGVNSYFIGSGEDQAKGIEEWKTLVFNVIDERDYTVFFIGQMESFQTQQLLIEEAFTQVVDNQGNLISTATFVSIAEKYQKIIDLDKGVTIQVINYINTDQVKHAVAINLSTRSIKNNDFRAWLAQQIETNQMIASQLVFSLSAYAVAKEVNVYKVFIKEMHRLNVKVIIKRFETQSMSLDIVKQLKPDFIRLSREYSNGIDENLEKKAFVETMQEIAGLLDISILAENVHGDNDFKCLKAIGIAAVSR